MITGVGTVAVALGIGFAMQANDSTNRYTGPGEAPRALETTKAEAQVKLDDIDVHDITLTSAQPDDMSASIVQANLVPISLITEEAPQDAITPVAPVEVVCDVSITGDVTDDAIVQLSVEAPCHKSERVSVHHNGMVFTEMTDSAGNLSVDVPALAPVAAFMLAFDDGEVAILAQEVPDLAKQQRVVLQWSGMPGFELHALEFGAEYGEAGHIWSGADTDLTVDGPTGSLTQLGYLNGADVKIAQIYTFPNTSSDRTNEIELAVEAMVNAENCGQKIDAKTLLLTDSRVVTTQEVTIDMPSCDGVGGYLVLNNLLDDLKITER